LFFAWFAIGLAALVVLRADVKNLRIALTAPILGSGLNVIPLFVLNNAGLPLSTGGPLVWGVLLVGSIAVLVWRRPRVSLAILPLLVLCLVQLVLVGRPMFHFGFNWIADANGDMGLYVLSATELLGHGLRTAVDVKSLSTNRNYPAIAQVLNLLGLRPGTQIGLGGVAAVTGRSPLDLYMPMSIAIGMSTVCATGALAMQASCRWWAASVAGLLLVVSPMAGYGVVQQLLPQDWGLGLAVALFAWLMRAELYRKPGPRALDLVVISVLAVALSVVAYEVATTLVLAYVFYLALIVVRRRVSLRAAALVLVVPVIAIAVAFNTYLPPAYTYIRYTVLPVGTSGFAGVSLFGYAIVPTALPGAAGLVRLFAGPQTPHMDWYIVAAAVLFAGLLIACVVTAMRGAAAGITLLADLVLGAVLASKSNDFGLFKLYMYAQPFVAATVAVFVADLKWRRAQIAIGALLVVVVGFQVSTLNAYVDQSRNPVDLRNASNADLLPKFRRLYATATVPVISVTDNFALEEAEGASVGEKPLYFLGRTVFTNSWTKRVFEMPSPHGVTRIAFNENASASRVIKRGSCLVLLPSGSQVVLNRRSLPEGSPTLVARRCGQMKNLLAFVVSSRGQPATLPAHKRAVSFWQLENDPSFPGRTFAGFGRYALFQILGPTPTMRVVLELSTSPIQRRSGSQLLPPAGVAGGGQRARFPVIGSGSARVISPPIRPTIINGRPYIMLDMGRKGEYPLVPRPGLTDLWKKSASLDPRAITSYVRDVSLISADNYDRLRAPSAIRSFPANLANPNLEYSGIYEDGWIGQTSYAKLSGGPAGHLVVRALVVPRSQGQRLRVIVNGRSVLSRTMKPGLLNVDVAIPPSARRRMVELRWAGATRLAAPDTRSAAAHLTFLGILTPPAALRSIPADLTKPGLVTSGVLKDGWLQKDARIVLAGGAAGNLTLRANVLADGQRLSVLVNGRTVASRVAKPGELDLSAPVPASASARAIELRWARTAPISSNDPRPAAALLQAIAVPH
jgi:hypothetical protein